MGNTPARMVVSCTNPRCTSYRIAGINPHRSIPPSALALSCAHCGYLLIRVPNNSTLAPNTVTAASFWKVICHGCNAVRYYTEPPMQAISQLCPTCTSNNTPRTPANVSTDTGYVIQCGTCVAWHWSLHAPVEWSKCKGCGHHTGILQYPQSINITTYVYKSAVTINTPTRKDNTLEQQQCPNCDLSFDAWLLPAHMKACEATIEAFTTEASPTPKPIFDKAFEVTVGEDGFLRPTLRTDLLLPTATSRYIERVVRMLDSGPQNLLLTGPAGTGKTAIAYQAAAILGCPMAKINIQPLETANELYGRATIANDSIVYEHSEFSRAATYDEGPIVVLLDDIAHQSDRTVCNGLLPALDKTRRVTILGLGTVTVGRSVLFIGTANQGGDYTGASKLDGALYDRFSHRLVIDNLPVEAAAQLLADHHGISLTDASALARTASEARTKSCYVSMRGMENAAEHMRYGATVDEAIEHVLLAGFPYAQVESLFINKQIDSSELLINSADDLSEWSYWTPTATAAEDN